ncbi:MAG: hypothetical protein PWP08_1131 [Methanofollis sp.]|nr:hypothetical protein [Methanofollis sp.]
MIPHHTLICPSRTNRCAGVRGLNVPGEHNGVGMCVLAQFTRSGR